MDNLFDLIIPVAFVIGSLFVSRMMKRNKEEESSEDDSGEVTDFNDLKEEIRKRIYEAQQQTRTPERTPSMQQASQAYRREVDERPQPDKVVVSEDKYASMRHQIEKIRAKADIEKRKAASIMKGKGRPLSSTSVFHAPIQNRLTRGLISEVINELHHPASARKAVINAEILGAPVGLRRPGQVHASWEQ